MASNTALYRYRTDAKFNALVRGMLSLVRPGPSRVSLSDIESATMLALEMVAEEAQLALMMEGRTHGEWDRFEIHMHDEFWSAINKFGLQEHLPDEAMLAVLVEEVGECARWLNERNLGTKVELEDYYHELVQVAAMACKAWCVAKARHDIQTNAEPQAAIKEAK